MYLFIVATLIILLIILWILCILDNKNKHYDHYVSITDTPYQRYGTEYESLHDPHLQTYTNYPFWNLQVGSKRGMSYDLRGDIPIPYRQFAWNNGTRIPIRNKPLAVIS